MGCVESASLEPPGDGKSMLFWPPDELAHQVASTRQNDRHGNKIWFQFRAYQTMINQEAIFNVLLGHTVNQLPYPPDEIAYKFAGRPRVLEGHACQILVNEKAIFNKLPQVQSFREATQT